MGLRRLLKGISYKWHSDLDDVQIDGIEYDSRKVQQGSLFVCMPGAIHDGHKFAADAVKKGAAALLVERHLDINCPQVEVINSRQSLAKLAVNYFQSPAQELALLGVTGTNGKTTIVHMLKSITEQKAKSALVGTVGVKIGSEDYLQTVNTSPESLDFQAMLRDMVNQGVKYIAAEVSSQGLAEYRLDHCAFDVAIFNNLSQDHLDYHKTMENYFVSKSLLFSRLKPGGFSVINMDDPYGERLASMIGGKLLSFSMRGAGVCNGEILEETAEHTIIKLSLEGTVFEVKLPMIFKYNAYNALAAATTAWALGFDANEIRSGLEKLEQVPGRMEQVKCGQESTVFIDYAHTPDALEQALLGLNKLKTKRLLVLFGSVGSGDREKRPMMAQIAERLGDVVIATHNNPRWEEPSAIVDEIVAGFSQNSYSRFDDRREAVTAILAMAEPGDIVLLAGMGHRKYMQRNEQNIPYDEREAVIEFFRTRAEREIAVSD